MEQIAFVIGSHYIYWSSVILTLAAAAAVCLFLSFYVGKSRNTIGAFSVVPIAVLLSLLAARLLHWYCYTESYPSLIAAVTNLSTGKLALLGCFAGSLMAAMLTRLLRLHRNLPQMLDCMCLAGCAGIAAGRLSCFFNASDRGDVLASIQSMPWAYPVVNSISGETEYRFATFLIQAMITGVLFLALTVFFLRKKAERKDGDVALLFLLCYSAVEIVLDSTRYDSMYFRSNGFVSIIQVCGAAAMVAGMVMIAVRLIKVRGMRGWYFPIWFAMAALTGCAGYMEYHVQRHGDEAPIGYTVMSCCLGIAVSLSLMQYILSRTKYRSRKQVVGKYSR